MTTSRSMHPQREIVGIAPKRKRKGAELVVRGRIELPT
jgi:hypothetical protein